MSIYSVEETIILDKNNCIIVLSFNHDLEKGNSQHVSQTMLKTITVGKMIKLIAYI